MAIRTSHPKSRESHDLSDGLYVVQLTLPAECQATSGDSRQISIAARRTTAVRFVVTCR